MGKVSGIKQRKIESLIPYENNAKVHSDQQIGLLVESIREFGFINPVLIDNDGVVIAGHGRLQAAREMGLDSIPTIKIEGLTEAQKRAYIIADNRLAELGTKWDKSLAVSELELAEGLDFDVSMLDFELPKVDELESGYYGDERDRTNKAYNLEMAHHTKMTDDFWQMPVIQCDDDIPNDLMGFNYAMSSKNKDTWIHFFVDDYQFERIWNNPEKYVDILGEYRGILSPDFSLYLDMPMPMKIWNTYRSRQIGAFYQQKGIPVIPTLSWAEATTFDFCFKGIPEESIIAVSTIGVKEDKEALKIWEAGMSEAMRQIKPQTVIVYGGKLDFDYGKTEVIYFENKVTENWKNDRND